MSGIRVTYTGLISFIIGIISVLTGIIFTIIVTRKLTPEEFGIWNLIGSLIYYVMIVEPIISYWVTREIARGEDSGKTAIVTSGLFSVGGMLAYLVITYFVSQELQSDPSILYLAVLLVPVTVLNRTLTAINLGWKPQVSSYGILAIELTKIPAALIFVYFLHMGISGAIYATVIAYLASTITLSFFARKKILGEFKKLFVRKWIKLSWVSLYPNVSNVIYHLDLLIFSFLTGSVIGLAFYAAANTVANIVGHSSLISQSVYPKLLGGGSREHFQENLTLFFYFSIPLSAIAIVFSKPALFALNPEYDVAVPIVIMLTIRTFAYVLGGMSNQALLGIEKVDINEKAKVMDFIKSKLFQIPTILLIQYSSYVIALVIMLTVVDIQTVSTVNLVFYWSVISLLNQIPFSIYFYIIIRRKLKFTVFSKKLINYVLTSIGVFGLTFYLMEHFLVFKESIFEFLPDLLLFLIFGIGLYLLITFLIDNKIRDLFRGIFKEITK